MPAFPFYRQLDAMDCGPTCLRMVAKHHGKAYTLQYLRERCYLDREGVSLKGISEAAEQVGFRTLAVKIPFDAPNGEPSLSVAPLPLIAHWNQKHFLVVFKVSRRHVWVADPGADKIKLPIESFKRSWVSDQDKGIALLLELGMDFFKEKNEGEVEKLSLFGFFSTYLRPYKRLMANLALGLLLTAFFQLAFPFLTQAVVDVGIDNKDIGFIWLILVGQLMLFFASTIVGFIQSWIFLHISARVGIGLIADFLYKLMELPLGFFDTKFTGDLLQRIGDQRRIESFLTQSVFQIVLGVISLVVFGAVLAWYSLTIFLLFTVGTAIYFIWILRFLKKRKEIDYQSFQQMSDTQNHLIEIIQGRPEVKLSGSQLKRRWAWATVQAKLFRIQMKSLALGQWQDGGAQVINQLKDILITFLAAKAVMDGQMTLGMMLAVQYMVGRLNAPLQQMMGFIRSAQDASISLERLGEVHAHPSEETPSEGKQLVIPEGNLVLQNLSFRYTPISNDVLQDIDLTIPRGKVTAIVGTSGSGKTTLIKLLLGFYQPTKGVIKVGSTPLDGLHLKTWRSACGVVMQDGFIFSDTIAHNIAESEGGFGGYHSTANGNGVNGTSHTIMNGSMNKPSGVNQYKLQRAAHTANIHEFIEDLPLGFNTMIGARGNGISQGQRQRMLIARAVYKDPAFIFLDEATNALDAHNERIIIENLDSFFKGRTVVVIAHRLSTVRHADQIVVLEKGLIVEVGTHEQLTFERGAYYNLVKNQLELGA